MGRLNLVDLADPNRSGYAPYISVSQPDDNCQLILTTPAHVSEEHCGVPVAAYSHAACGSVTVDSTFMVQYCCGAEDCNNAGVGLRSLGGKPKKIELTVDGKVVEPAQIGSPPPAIRQLESAKLRTLVKNDDDDDGICDGDWVADEGKEDYTRESDDRQVVYSNFNGGEVQITKTREQSWTQETSASLGFADVLSLGLSFSESYEKSVSDSTSYTYSTKPGQTGSIVFTPTLRCSTGMCKARHLTGRRDTDDGLDRYWHLRR